MIGTKIKSPRKNQNSSFQFDENFNLKSLFKDGKRTLFQLEDSNNRIDKIIDHQGNETKYTYDKSGRLFRKEENGANGELKTFTYEPVNNMVINIGSKNEGNSDYFYSFGKSLIKKVHKTKTIIKPTPDFKIIKEAKTGKTFFISIVNGFGKTLMTKTREGNLNSISSSFFSNQVKPYQSSFFDYQSFLTYT